MKVGLGLYDYLFYSINKHIKKIYPAHLDPIFYSVMVMYLLGSIVLIPLIYWIINVHLGLNMPKWIWMVVSGLFFAINLWYFNKDRVREIENKFYKIESKK